MCKILLSLKTTGESHWFNLSESTSETFHNEVLTKFKLTTFKRDLFEIEEVNNIPFEYRHAGLTEKIIADYFWVWKNLNTEDQELLLKYMQFSQNDESTIEEAKKFFEKDC
jgi:hypothetical protein